MILFLQIFFTILLALMVGSFFYYVFKYTGPWGSYWTFVVTLILAGLVAAVWIEPVGPMIYNFAWAPILIVILIFALFLAATSPRRYRTSNPARKGIPAPAEKNIPALAVSTIFWIFMAAMLIAFAVGVFRERAFL